MEVTGIIIRRRSLGKHLAFADVEVITNHRRSDGEEESDHLNEADNKQGDIIHVAFRRTSVSWDTTRDNTFPTKNSLLPYGAKISLQLCKRGGDGTHIGSERSSHGNDEGMALANQSGGGKAPSWEVSSWDVITHPHKIATDHARQKITADDNLPNNEGHCDKGGILCTAYFKSRADNYFGHHQNLPPKLKSKQNVNIINSYEGTTATGSHVPSTSSVEGQESHGGDKRSKALRAQIFASWLLNKFGSDLLNKDGTNGVLDIAGGKHTAL